MTDKVARHRSTPLWHRPTPLRHRRAWPGDPDQD